MKIWAILSVAAISLIGTISLFSSKANSSVVAPTPDKAKVLIQEMKTSDDTRRLLVPAMVEAKMSSLVTAEVEGFVTKIVKPLGSRVKSGEVVLYVENKDPAFTYAKVPVRSPISGVVSQFSAALMTRVSRGDKLFVVMDPRELKLTAEIPGSDLAMIKPGTAGVFKQNLDDKEGAPLRVSGISPLVDPRTGTAAAELEFVITKGKEPALPSIGMVGHALFEMSRGKILLIPESALGYLDGKPSVKILDAAGKVKRKDIELGEQKESLLVVKSGLAEGEKLIVRSNRNVKDGEAVDVESETKKN
ncbi:MAG: efflux RND transporter periplasmic adaptor subunit [Bdellovibrionota bacterium]